MIYENCLTDPTNMVMHPIQVTLGLIFKDESVKKTAVQMVIKRFRFQANRQKWNNLLALKSYNDRNISKSWPLIVHKKLII